MTVYEMRRKAFEYIIEYMNDSYDHGSHEVVADAILSVCEQFMETMEFYTDYYGEHIEFPLEWK